MVGSWAQLAVFWVLLAAVPILFAFVAVQQGPRLAAVWLTGITGYLAIGLLLALIGVLLMAVL